MPMEAAPVMAGQNHDVKFLSGFGKSSVIIIFLNNLPLHFYLCFPSEILFFLIFVLLMEPIDRRGFFHSFSFFLLCSPLGYFEIPVL